MRRIYDSDALSRDDDDPFSPAESDDRSRRAIDWNAASHALLPIRLRDRAVTVALETNKDEYALDEPVGWRATFRNRLPFPVRLVTESPELWRWSINGVTQASEVPGQVPDRRSAINFSRSERKVFERTWRPQIRISESEWEPIGPGEHTLRVELNVECPEDRGLVAEETFRITP